MALEPVEEAWPVPDQAEGPRHRWFEKAGAVLYVFFCFEIGILLVLMPWLNLWDRNYLSGFGAGWSEIWLSPYFRGAVSGLGLLDIGIAFTELFRLRRFARTERPGPSRPSSLE